jgi:hypothetical protein
MKKTLTAILLILFISQLNAQELKEYLSDLTERKTDHYEKGLNLYANAEYAKAYKKLLKSKSNDIPYLKSLLSNSILYQRNIKLIEKNLDIVPENYKFFIKQPKMKIELSKSTSVGLDKNLFKAILNDKDGITIMLDTGGSGVGINKEFVEKYNMERDTTISKKGSLPAFNVTFYKHPVIIPKIQIGEMIMTNICAEYSVIDPDSKGTYTGPEFDVIIGLDTFIGFLEQVSFDWDNKVLEFQKHTDIKEGTPFMFYNSKPFTSFGVNDEILTTIIDTGSPNDILSEEIYLKNYSNKEKKTYNEYSYTEYTVDFEMSEGKFLTLKIGDYNKGLDLKIGGEKIDLLLGNKHQKLEFNLAKNIFNLN